MKKARKHKNKLKFDNAVFVMNRLSWISSYRTVEKLVEQPDKIALNALLPYRYEYIDIHRTK